MKITRTLLLLAALSPAALLLTGCGKKPDATAPATKAAAKDLVADAKAVAADTWDSIKDYTHEKREDVAATLDRMGDKSAAGISALNAKLAGLPDAAAKVRDSASKEFAEASADLKAKTAELRASSADTWSAAKDKAAKAWERVQAAYEKLKAGPTS